MNEDDVVGQFIYATLVSDATLAAAAPGGIHEGVAGADVVTPYVVYQNVSAVDVMVVGAIRVMSNQLWDITVVTQGRDGRVPRAAVDRIDQLMHASDGSVVGGGVVLSFVREVTRRRGPERDPNDGKLYMYRTQEFRVQAQKVAA